MNGNALKIVCISTTAAMVVVLGLFVTGVWGTTPPDFQTMVGTKTIVLADGSDLLDINVQEDGETSVRYRGMELKGMLARRMSDQESATYDLQIQESSVGDAKELQFQIQVPIHGITGEETGIWCIRFRNLEAEDQTNGMGAMFLGMSPKDVWYAQYGKQTDKGEVGEDSNESGDLPYELFDWILIQPDGAGKMLNERVIPMNNSNEELAANARNVTWNEIDDILTLTEA